VTGDNATAPPFYHDKLNLMYYLAGCPIRRNQCTITAVFSEKESVTMTIEIRRVNHNILRCTCDDTTSCSHATDYLERPPTMRRFALKAIFLALISVPGIVLPRSAFAEEQGNAKTLRVAIAQIPVTADIATNAATIHRALDKAIEAKAEILLTPEGSLSGYTHLFDQKQVDKHLPTILEKARAAHLALALGTCFVEPLDSECYNQIRFYDIDGTYRGFHSKTLLCGTLTEPPVGEINHFSVQPLKTYQIKGITVGGLICNDLWANPQCTPMPDSHLTQMLSDKGARIIFQAINGGRNGGDFSENIYWPYHESNQRLRTVAGKLFLVAADNCAPTKFPCSAPSGVCGPSGKWLARAVRQGEEVVVYTINLN
jgi:predicted amidohydrolase